MKNVIFSFILIGFFFTCRSPEKGNSIVKITDTSILGDDINVAIKIEDEALEKIILDQLGLKSSQELNSLRVREIKEIETPFDYKGNKIQSLKGLEYFSSLETINLPNHLIQDLSPISRLKSIRKLNLRANKISQIRDLISLNKIEEIVLDDNPLQNKFFATLIPFYHLRYLSLVNCNITSLNQFPKLPNIRTLILSKNQIRLTQVTKETEGNIETEVLGFDNFPYLEDLDLSYNLISEPRLLNQVQYLPYFRKINLKGNPIKKDRLHLNAIFKSNVTIISSVIDQNKKTVTYLRLGEFF